MDAATIAFWCGAGLSGAATLQMLDWVVDGFRRAAAERRRHAAEMELLQAQIAAARASAGAVASSSPAWTGWRKFRVARKIRESIDSVSLYLAPHDGRPLPSFEPGRHLTVSLRIDGVSAPVVRCYSLSAPPSETEYRITVKRIESTAGGDRRVGLASGWLCDRLDVDDLIDVKPPRGDFTLEASNQRPIVLLGAGIGVTPLACMASAALAAGCETTIHCLLGMRDGAHHPLKQEMAAWADEHPNLHLLTAYSRPRASDQAGRDYDLAGRLTIDVVRRLLPSSNYRFLLCGPGEFMHDLVQGLRDWGVPEADVRFEAFGPSSLKAVEGRPVRGTAGAKVTFGRSGKHAAWSDDHGSLLELAESLGAEVAAGCRSGSCGTCLTPLRSGRVASEAESEAGSCLICVSAPVDDVVLDA